MKALDLVASRLAECRGDAFATLCSAKATNEDGCVQQKFARLVMGSNNIDHCTRLCHSPSVEATLAALGSGATGNSYTDYEGAGCLLAIGCDPLPTIRWPPPGCVGRSAAAGVRGVGVPPPGCAGGGGARGQAHRRQPAPH